MSAKENPGALAGASGAGLPCYAIAAGNSNIAQSAGQCHCADQIASIVTKLQTVIDELQTVEILTDLRCRKGGGND